MVPAQTLTVPGSASGKTLVWFNTGQHNLVISTGPEPPPFPNQSSAVGSGPDPQLRVMEFPLSLTKVELHSFIKTQGLLNNN